MSYIILLILLMMYVNSYQVDASENLCQVAKRKGCDVVSRTTVTRVDGWSGISYKCQAISSTIDITCYLVDGDGEVVLKSSKCAGDDRELVLKMTGKENRNYTVEQFWQSGCFVTPLTVMESPQTCDRSSMVSTIPIQYTQGKHARRPCFTRLGVSGINLNGVNFTSGIYRECKEEIARANNDKYLQIVFPTIEYKDAGLYSCFINNTGKFLFYSYNISVCEPFIPTPSLKCEHNRVVTSNGKDIRFNCTVIRGSGGTKDAVNSIIEEKQLYLPNGNVVKCTNKKEDFANQDTSCFVADYGEERCHGKQPNETGEVWVTLTIIVRNVNASDLGNYFVTYKSFYNPDIIYNETVRVEIRMSRGFIPPLIACMVFIFFILILLYLAIFCFKYDICWLWKKIFGGYDKANFRYGAYIAYYYHSDMESRAKNNLQRLLGEVEDQLERMQCSVFDDHKHDCSYQYEINRIQEMQDKCHRTIIVLTKEYITDYLSIHTTNVALQNLVENNKKVIFISFPETKKYLKKKMKDETAVTLLNSLKLNHNIMWNRRIPLTGSFVRHLEYAMPKLKDRRKKDVFKERKNKNGCVKMETIASSKSFGNVTV